MENRWHSLDNKDIWNQIYLVNWLLDFYDTFKGSFISERAIEWSKHILLNIMEKQGANLS